jgi:hypothetical protein
VTLVRPIPTYGSDSWPLKRKEENMLRIFERRVLRRINGPIEENGIWRSRYNHELHKLCNEPDMVSDQSRSAEMTGTTACNAGSQLYRNPRVLDELADLLPGGRVQLKET